MQIKVNKTKSKVPFKNITEGTIFKYCDSYFIKTHEIVSGNNVTINALSLCSNTLIGFGKNLEVESKDAVLNIED